MLGQIVHQSLEGRDELRIRRFQILKLFQLFFDLGVSCSLTFVWNCWTRELTDWCSWRSLLASSTPTDTYFSKPGSTTSSSPMECRASSQVNWLCHLVCSVSSEAVIYVHNTTLSLGDPSWSRRWWWMPWQYMISQMCVFEAGSARRLMLVVPRPDKRNDITVE